VKTVHRYPETDALPAWYEFGMKDAKTLFIKIHRKAWKEVIDKIRSDAPIIQMFQKDFADNPSFGSFVIPSDQKPWGFGNILFPKPSSESDWFLFLCPLPILYRNGKHTSGGDWALRATLSLFFTALWLCEDDTEAKRPQLMVIEGLRVDKEIYGGSLSVTLTPQVTQWLAKQEDRSTLDDVEIAMQAADHHMWRNKKFISQPYDFRVMCRQPKWINFTVPGNACGLDPSDYNDQSPENGYRLSPHNTDTGFQQLTLLVGLAKLQDLIRKDLQ
jgi:hypothetical protein